MMINLSCVINQKSDLMRSKIGLSPSDASAMSCFLWKCQFGIFLMFAVVWLVFVAIILMHAWLYCVALILNLQ